MAKLLQVGRTAVSKQVLELIDLGYVEAKRTGRSSLYRVILDTPEAGRGATPPDEVVEGDRPIPPEVASGSSEDCPIPPEVESDSTSRGGIYRTTVSNGSSSFGTPTRDAPSPFDHFWPAYPARDGKRLGKAKARELFDKLPLDEQRAAYRGARHFSAAVAAGGRHGVPDAHRWLRNREWEEWQDPALLRHPASKNHRPTGLDAVAEYARQEGIL